MRKNRIDGEIKPGQVFSAEVKDLASDGRGVLAHPQGRTFFVAGVWPGERGKFRVSGLKGRIGFAELTELDADSANPGRVRAPCPHHGFSSTACGGCPWQFMDYAEQLVAKQGRLEASLARIGVNRNIAPIVPSPEIFGYRNRAQLKTDGTQLGYVAAASNRLVAVQQCPVLSTHNQQTLQGLLEQLPNSHWRPQQKHKWTTLDIDESVSAANPAVNQRLPFQQANSRQNLFILQWLEEQLAEKASGKSIVELFCGSGNLTGVLAAAGAEKVLAVEVVEAALERLRELALPGVETLACDLFDEVQAPRLQGALREADILVLDPPREGLKTRQLVWPKKTALRSICYISCDLATFVRDVEFFMQQGFRLSAVQPVDQFPHTPHLEMLASLSR